MPTTSFFMKNFKGTTLVDHLRNDSEQELGFSRKEPVVLAALQTLAVFGRRHNPDSGYIRAARHLGASCISNVASR